MLQGQSQIAGKEEEEREIWFTCHALALRATREAIDQNSDVKAKVREEKSDKCLTCVQKSRPPKFSKSLVAIVMCVSVIDYRINLAAEKYIKGEGKKKKFKCLGLWKRWCSIMEFLGKTVEADFFDSICRIRKWVTIRNKLAHGDYRKILKLQISPEEAVSCHDDTTRAIFALNTALGDYGTKEENQESCERMLLRQKKIST